MMAFVEWFLEWLWPQYWLSRPWSSLWKGLPAVICMGLGMAALGAVCRQDGGALATRFEDAAIRARDGSNQAVEDLCLRRLLVLQPANRRIRYQYAAALARKNENGGGAQIMQSLAPLDHSGYAPAHYWLAQQMMNPKLALSPGQIRLLEQHLELSLLGQDAQPAARLELVAIALRSKRWEVAAQHLEELVPRRPDLQMALAAVYRQQGDEIRAATTSGRAVTYYAKLVQQVPQDDASRLRWAEALVFQRKLREALKVLQAANASETDPRYGAAIAQVFLVQMGEAGTALPELSAPADGMTSRGRVGRVFIHPSAPADAMTPANRTVSSLELASRIELLERALHYAPNHPVVLNAIAQLSTQETPEGDQARSWLKDALARGDTPATVHLILGTAAATKGDMKDAAFHLEQAVKRDPKLAMAANNLACVLADSDPSQPERALRLVDAALLVMPHHPEIRETRGQILLKLGRYQEAILDLEYVLKKLPSRRRVHAGLAAAYRSLENSDLAERHKRMAEDLENKPVQAQPQR